MKISSSAFISGGSLPPRFAREEGNTSPPLTFTEIPAEAASIALVMEDPDAPRGTFTHWLVWNIPTHGGELGEDHLPAGAVLGKNDFGDVGYGGPRPPSGTHRYYFHAYALDCQLDLPAGASRQQLEHAMEKHVLENASVMGRFSAPLETGARA
jgi:Raf kinase inhibitor-like YbhB/YbcL family protein